MLKPFTPGQTQNLILGTTTSALTLNADAPIVCVLLNSTNASACAFVRIGTGAQTATANDFPIPPNVPTYLTKGVGANGFAALANAPGSGAILYVTTGA